MNIILVVLFIIASITNCLTFNKQITNTTATEVCLDGQPAFVYTLSNQPSTQRGMIVYFMDIPSSSFCGGSSLADSL